MGKVSDVVVECLEAEGARWVFGIPGEETLDLNESLSRSSVEFVPVRHEQAAAFMAGVYGRLTGRAGVCLGTLGPGATNLATGVADAFLDRAPLVALTGQAGQERMHKESHQHIDVVRLMQPITKWNGRLSDPVIAPELVRKAFKLAETDKPGATHIELPESVLEAELEATPLPRHGTARPQARPEDISRAARLISGATSPIALAGNGVVRAQAAEALREFAHSTGLRVAKTFMGKGLLDTYDDESLGAVGLQAGDYEMAGFGTADVVVAVGYDLVEHAPAYWNPHHDKRIVCIDSLPAEIDDAFIPEVELVGNLADSLRRLSEEIGRLPYPGGSTRLREVTIGRFDRAGEDPDTPLQPPRVLWELRRALERQDILVSDVGLHKLWIGRMFPALEPQSVLIANGLAGMGFAVPAAIAAKLVHPERRVVAVSGDGGFLMNAAELETALRLRTPFVNVVWEDHAYGSIVRHQEQKFGRHFGTGFGNPDFVGLARAFGLPAWRCESAGEFAARLREALGLDLPSLIVLPIDYSVDVAIAEELGAETAAT
ncbi:MAG: acetolactate synthase large subunit [Actinomycetota bacterium]|nr:acetolactate synthase large subunit [Actinomycetota bacterium]